MQNSGYLRWTNFADDSFIALARNTVSENQGNFIETAPITGGAEHRQSRVLWHYSYQELYERMCAHLRRVMPNIKCEFPYAPDDPDIEVQLTLHGNGEYFKRHLDNGDDASRTRVLTFVYYFTMEDEPRFTEGKLAVELGDTRVVVEPEHNSLVMFASGNWHEVLATSVPSGRWEDSRMTLNGWIRRRG